MDDDCYIFTSSCCTLFENILEQIVEQIVDFILLSNLITTLHVEFIFLRLPAQQSVTNRNSQFRYRKQI